MMNGTDSVKKAAINKAKQVAGAANSNGSNGKKRRKQDLKPIITTEQGGSGNPYRYVQFKLMLKEMDVREATRLSGLLFLLMKHPR